METFLALCVTVWVITIVYEALFYWKNWTDGEWTDVKVGVLRILIVANWVLLVLAFNQQIINSDAEIDVADYIFHAILFVLMFIATALSIFIGACPTCDDSI